MKIKAFLAAMLLTLTLSAQKTILDGRITGMDNPRLYLFEVVNNKLQPRDTITPSDRGQFRLSFKLSDPVMYILKSNLPQSNDIQLLLHPDQKVSLEIEALPKHNVLVVTHTKGSKDMSLFSAFQRVLTCHLDLMATINNAYSLPGVTDAEKLRLSNQYMDLLSEQNVNVRRLLEANTDCLMAAFLVTYFEKHDFVTYIPLYEAVLAGTKPRYPDHPFVRHIEHKLATTLTEGRMAPEIDMLDPEGNHRKLSDLRGKVVMVDFWASWCRPCRMENPNVVKLYHKYKDAGFDIYSVSLDKQKADWQRAIQQDGLVWPNHVSDLNGWTSSGGAAYGVTSVPSTVLIDREGRIIARDLRGPDLERKLLEIFGF